MGGLTSYHLTLNESQLFEGAILMAPAFKLHIGRCITGIGNFFRFILPENTRLTRPYEGRSHRNPLINDFLNED